MKSDSRKRKAPKSDDKDDKTEPGTERPALYKTLSNWDRDTKLKLSTDLLTVVGEKGYRTVRGTVGISEGDCYFEVTINEPVPIGPKYPEAHTRLGWSTEKGNIEAPVGFDKFGYSYRDVKGTKFHQSIGQPYGEPYGPGDVIGCFIRLKDDQSEHKLKDLTPLQIQFREQAKQAAMLLPLSGSKIMFFKNGQSQGVAFSDIFKGTYFPAIALYMGASATVNFGPDFKFPPALPDTLGPYQPGADVVNPNHQGALLKEQEEKKGKLAKVAKPAEGVPPSPSRSPSKKKKSSSKKKRNNDTGPGSSPTDTVIEENG